MAKVEAKAQSYRGRSLNEKVSRAWRQVEVFEAKAVGVVMFARICFVQRSRFAVMDQPAARKSHGVDRLAVILEALNLRAPTAVAGAGLLFVIGVEQISIRIDIIEQLQVAILEDSQIDAIRPRRLLNQLRLVHHQNTVTFETADLNREDPLLHLRDGNLPDTAIVTK